MTIGLLTSGGDAPGMNACIATIAGCAERRGVDVRGILGGFRGLLQANTIPIGSELSGLARRGGTFLGTARNGDVEDDIAEQGAADALSRCCVDGLIVLGGGGSITGAARLAAKGIEVVAIPSTIDNDIFGTDYAIGFDSAVSKAVRAADEILDTAESLAERIFIIETLGGRTGHMAIAAAYASGADAVFIHEIPPDVECTAQRIKAKMEAGGSHGLVVVCEDLGTDEIARKLEASAARRVRVTTLGHTMRGGSPTTLDRTLARSYGEAAIEMLLSGDSGRMVRCSGSEVGSIALSEVAGRTREIDRGKYAAVMSQCEG